MSFINCAALFACTWVCLCMCSCGCAMCQCCQVVFLKSVYALVRCTCGVCERGLGVYTRAHVCVLGVYTGVCSMCIQPACVRWECTLVCAYIYVCVCALLCVNVYVCCYVNVCVGIQCTVLVCGGCVYRYGMNLHVHESAHWCVHSHGGFCNISGSYRYLIG